MADHATGLWFNSQIRGRPREEKGEGPSFLGFLTTRLDIRLLLVCLLSLMQSFGYKNNTTEKEVSCLCTISVFSVCQFE